MNVADISEVDSNASYRNKIAIFMFVHLARAIVRKRQREKEGATSSSGGAGNKNEQLTGVMIPG